MPVPLPTWDDRPMYWPDDYEVLAKATTRAAVKQRTWMSVGVWWVNGIYIDGATLLACLLNLPAHAERLQKQHGVRLAPDLLYWARVARWVFHLLQKGHFVPEVSDVSDEWSGYAILHSIWTPAPSEAVAHDMIRLVRSMPHAALRGVPKKTPNGSLHPEFHRLAADITYTFTQFLLDETIRDWIADEAIATEVRNGLLVKRWVNSLFDDIGEIHGTTNSLKKFVHGFAQWRESARQELDPMTALWLHLEPLPADEAYIVDRWRLTFGLQETKESHTGVDPDRLRDELQWHLRRASTIWSPLKRLFSSEDGQTTQGPTNELMLTSEEARSLLSQYENLISAGVIVRLPAWMKQAPPQVKVQLTVEPSADALLSLDSILHFDWQLSIGDVTLSPEQFRRLARQQIPVIQIRDEWVELSRRQIAEILSTWDRQDTIAVDELFERSLFGGPGYGERIVRREVENRPDQATTKVTRPNVDVEINVQGKGARRFEHLVNMLQSDMELKPLPPPKELRAELRPYQAEGFAWLAFMQELGFGCCLADDMGLGKTVQSLALVLRAKESARSDESARASEAKDVDESAGTGESTHDTDRASQNAPSPRPSLVICPTSVIENWAREVARFAPTLKTYVHYGTGRAVGDAFVNAATEADIVITSYALAQRDVESLNRLEWDVLIADEAQHIKNPQSKTARAVKSIAAGHRLALTGTPIENRLSELWAIMDFCNHQYLGSLEMFRNRFARPIERYDDRKRLELLRHLVGPFILRRKKTDPHIAADLPDKIEAKVYCPLTAEQAALYEATVQDMMRRIESTQGFRRKGLVFAALSRLKQICDHPYLFTRQGPTTIERSGKLQRLAELLEEVTAVGEKALVFTQFARMGHLLQQSLGKLLGEEPLFLHGGTSRARRDEMVDRFQGEGGPRVFILSLRAGGVGLNLTRATHVIHFDRWWNPAVESQATDRAFRIGQERNVHVHTLIVPGTLEERIDAMIEEKRALAQDVIEGGEHALSELSTEELRDIFALRKQALAR